MLSKEKRALIKAIWTPVLGDFVRLPAGRSVFKIVYIGNNCCIVTRWVQHHSKKGNRRVWNTLDDRTLFFDSYLFKGLRPVTD
jgi:hypothetical protein